MYEYRCEVVKVIDGDTVDVDIDLGFGVWLKDERVRLYGIDTPESKTRDLEEKKYGLLAKKFVQTFLEGKKVKLVTREYDSKGKFGRILGDLHVDGFSLCECLIGSHNAVTYHGQSKNEIAEAHLANREKIIIS
jgi:micrococcal nuclease